MDKGDAGKRGIQICRYPEISDHMFQELSVQRQSMSTAYAQQSQVSPLKFPKEERCLLQTQIIPSEGTNHFMPSRAPPHEQSGTTDLAKYLIHKEMVSSGLLKFDDRPENYWDLNVTPREELNLLTKWLGPQSAEQAKRIHAVHTHNASSGLQMVWQRLEECYGSAEMIENALLKKLEEFPKISNRDNEKLRELGDLLLELEAVRKDGFLPGLSYLNTPRGVNPIAQKLPYNLQEKWISVGSKYKDDYQVQYPPFCIFVKFIRDQAKTWNDPSFAELTMGASIRTEKPLKHVKPSVFTRKTEVSSEGEYKQNNVERKVEGPDRLCPLYNKLHPLRKCRGFSSKPLEERKAYLK